MKPLKDIYTDICSGVLKEKELDFLTWFGDRNSWLLSFIYMLSPSNCGQKQTERGNKYFNYTAKMFKRNVRVMVGEA